VHTDNGAETPTNQASKIFPGSTSATAVLRPTRRVIGGKGRKKWILILKSHGKALVGMPGQ